MKVRASFELDLETGDWEVLYNNLSDPGENVDLTATMDLIKKVVGQIDKEEYEQIDELT